MQGHQRKDKKGGGGFNMVGGVRLALEPEVELYAAVLKIMGGGMCSVKCQDGLIRNCVIRQKFRGRDKRRNMLAPGSWVLVGLRDWEGTNLGKMPKCDLLEVYSAQEKDSLVQVEKRDLSLLAGAGIVQGTARDTEFDFVDEKTQGYRDLIEGLSEGEDDEEESEEDEGVEDRAPKKPKRTGRDRFMGGDDELVSIDDI
jgi:translation initiation factor IF-1